jgi:predicted trehalose synthase
VKTSLSLDSATRDRLNEVRPATLSWDAFLQVLRDSVDEARLSKNLELVLDDEESKNLQRAVARVGAMRADPDASLALGAARERLRRRRLAIRLARLVEELKAETPTPRIADLAQDLDEEIREALRV